MNRGIVGTQKVNIDIQNMLNGTATDQTVSYNGYQFKIKDRVMQIRNNYTKLVFNGDIGIITNIDKTDQIMHISFLDRVVEYEFNELDELVLAYAISIHKSQGSEFDAAIIPIFMQHYMLLRRNLIYTAITRAKKLCIFIGQPKAIGMAINNTKDIKRITFLQDYLSSELQCR
jgi:exodeoxyribonuclease V alpha subunit